jgi:hypothetical protein
MQAHSLRAPKADGTILAEPPLDRARDSLGENRARFAGWNHDFQGRRYSVLRDKARAEAVEAAVLYHRGAGIDVPGAIDLDAPIIATGHQPELFHPGVWVKNFAVAAIASEARGIALNMIVDNDIPKGAFIRVPSRTPGGLRTQIVAFDDWTGEAPFEDQPIRDERFFAGFPGRVHDVLDGQVARPLVDRFWAHVESAPAGMPGRERVGLRFARARRIVEAEWGTRNLEVPLSALCETDGFRWFACHLLANLPRFRAVHNAALDRYRALYHIRSKNHPVASLVRDGGWLESPFWAWRASEPRRRPLMVRQLERSMELRIGGEEKPIIEIPLSEDREACCAVEALRELPDRGIRLRTRALTTTMFARFLLGDLFVHGIGGAKYDELGDEIARGFFGIDPPRFLTLSMTLHLGLPTSSATVGKLRDIDRQIRDLSWQPERFLDHRDDLDVLVDEKRRLIAEQPHTKADRLARYRSFRNVNSALAVGVEDRRTAHEKQRAELVAAIRDNDVAGSRDFSIVLFEEDRIRSAMARVSRAVRA